MKKRELINLGLPKGPILDKAIHAVVAAAGAGMNGAQIRDTLKALVRNPGGFAQHPQFGDLAKAFDERHKIPKLSSARSEAAEYRRWGRDLDDTAIQQMENACMLPVSVRGALMPDAHVGYGLPIGGVLATDNAVIPYAVGVDIACRMKMTVLDLPLNALERLREKLTQAIETETKFGVGSTFKRRRNHDVMDADWLSMPVTREFKDKAWAQLGTSGSGNHFVEFGELAVREGLPGLAPGHYVALLSHSGSRGTGAAVASHYSKLAMKLHPELDSALRQLAWLDLGSHEGQEYWHAMQLMGRYAAANHALIHRYVAKHLGAEVLFDLENHHNFAWKEMHDGKEVIVHRKGATPAGEGVLGIIPGSMAAPGYIVRGKGNPASLDSAAHGAGRRMSRKQATKEFRWPQIKQYLEEQRVTLLSAGLDEAPMAYKNIEEVMAAQSDLVEPLAKFTPRLVKMAPAGERPED
ncbi:MAG: RtcB family protein [FCB group bacterium]|jgi:tRNA-splicing ligase RtcB|nr:RtcB family protein [FCB group bacterium]